MCEANLLMLIFGSMSRSGTIVTAVGLFIGTALLSVWLEHPFQSWIRRLCEAHQVRFIGKYFQLFTSPLFMFGLATWAVCVFLWVRKFKSRQLVFWVVLVCITFILVAMTHASLWAAMRVVECTACEDGIRYMQRRELPKDRFLLTALLISLLPLFVRARIAAGQRSKVATEE